MSVLLMSLFAASLSAQPAPAATPPGDTVIVTGERIRDLRDALARCLARGCPPDEDVNASLALAEGHFLNGDYEDSERAIAGSIGRNRRHAGRYPEPVADLYRSVARVQSHQGRDGQAERSTFDILRSLRAGLPQEDHRHFTARLEIIQFQIRNGNTHGARRELRELINAARAAGREDVARVAEMRRLQVEYAITPYGPTVGRLREMAGWTDPARQFEAVSARLFLARVYRTRGDIAASDAMLAGIPPSDGDRRALLHAPTIRLTREDSGRSLLPGMDDDNYEDKWIDVGYWIEANGRVSSVEVVRQGSRADWAEPVLASIRGRLYASSTDRTPSYRLERYSYTAARGTRTGSRILARTGGARVEYLDLTAPTETGRAPDAALPPGQN